MANGNSSWSSSETALPPSSMEGIALQRRYRKGSHNMEAWQAELGSQRAYARDLPSDTYDAHSPFVAHSESNAPSPASIVRPLASLERSSQHVGLVLEAPNEVLVMPPLPPRTALSPPQMHPLPRETTTDSGQASASRSPTWLSPLPLDSRLPPLPLAPGPPSCPLMFSQASVANEPILPPLPPEPMLPPLPPEPGPPPPGSMAHTEFPPEPAPPNTCASNQLPVFYQLSPLPPLPSVPLSSSGSHPSSNSGSDRSSSSGVRKLHKSCWSWRVFVPLEPTWNCTQMPDVRN